MMLFGLCYGAMSGDGSLAHILSSFLSSPSKYGYWYLMSLSVCYVSLQVFRLNVWRRWTADVVLAVAVWVFFFLMWKCTAQTNDYFCLLNCANFYPFFILGVFVRKYDLLSVLSRHKWVYSLALVSSVMLLATEMPWHALDSLSRHVVTPFLLLIVMVSVFLERHDRDSGMERLMAYVGRHTLDIYVLHYFFVSRVSLAVADRWLEATGNTVLSFVLSSALAVVITGLSLGLGWMLHRGTLIEKVAFGRW